jgi:hypothetical protein
MRAWITHEKHSLKRYPTWKKCFERDYSSRNRNWLQNQKLSKDGAEINQKINFINRWRKFNWLRKFSYSILNAILTVVWWINFMSVGDQSMRRTRSFSHEFMRHRDENWILFLKKTARISSLVRSWLASVTEYFKGFCGWDDDVEVIRNSFNGTAHTRSNSKRRCWWKILINFKSWILMRI